MGLAKYNHKLHENQVVALWNECCINDLITKEKFRKQALFDENFNNDLCYVYLEDEMVVGFILATKRKFPYLERGLESDKGWINVLFVKETFRRKGIATKLLTTVETKLQEMGAKTIILASYSPNYFFAGLDPDNYKESVEFFEHHGYGAIDKHYSMGMDLHGYKMSDRVLEKKRLAEDEGYVFKPFTYEYSLELLDFLKDEFMTGF